MLYGDTRLELAKPLPGVKGYSPSRELASSGQITEVELDIHDVLRGFERLKLRAALHKGETEGGSGKVGKWVAWVRKPLAD